MKHFLILFITQMEKGISKIRERCYQKGIQIFIMNGSTKIAIHASIFAIFLITVTKYLRKERGEFPLVHCFSLSQQRKNALLVVTEYRTIACLHGSRLKTESSETVQFLQAYSQEPILIRPILLEVFEHSKQCYKPETEH